ncbi:Mfa1 family fimbria major subunit [uncultured Bacteroides sp.]|uniref:Mfa1 family fimbria major subunit n=1 Tax=uncultured Bacteroides sp. TaxID=162156 RepID=UPI0025ECE8B7|nr:Mfa1 family fimbria major subunit [uncultured Bacteroides sp.]
MGKNKFLVAVFTMATLTFAACNNEELPAEVTGNNGNAEVVEGVPTYARLTVQMDGVKRTRTATETGTADEQNVKNIHVYVFANGLFETSTGPSGDVVSNSTGVFHSEVMKLTSGLKTILVVANKGTDWYPTPTTGTTLAAFQDQLMDMYTTPGRLAHDVSAVARAGDGYKKLQGMDNPADNGFLMSNLLSNSSFTLKPGISRADAERNDYGSEDPADYNHFKISLYRAAAKLQTTYNDANALIYSTTQGDDLSKVVTVGKLTKPSFTVRNLPQKVYLFQHGSVDSPLMTPLYNATNTNSSWGDFRIFDEVNAPDIEVVAKNETPNSLYLPENANAIPVIGNTSYVLVKGVFEPNRDLVITDVDNNGNYEYGFKGNSDPINVFTYSPAWGSVIYAVPASITGDQERLKHGINTTLKTYLVRTGLKAYINSNEKSPVYDGIIGRNVYYSIKPGAKDGIYNTLVISKNIEKDDKSYDATVVETVKYLQYNNGITYYRINIQDGTQPENHNLAYSITRNNLYKVNVKSISGIGYPNEGDVTVDPETPISQKTYMQAHISVEEWKVVDQDADLN